MPRAAFVFDQKRTPKGGKKDYTIDSFLDQYGPDDGATRWEASMPTTDKTEEMEIKKLVVLLRTAMEQVQEGDGAILSVIEKLVSLLPSSITTDPATGNKTSVLPRPAAAACLVPLVQKVRSQIDPVIALLKESLKSGETQVIRRSAALGLGSIIKGLGINAIKTTGIMAYCEELIRDSKNANGRQSVIFLYEALFRLFGYPFEPYIVKIVPHILLCFDDNPNVRDSAERTTHVIFGNLRSR